MIQPLRRLLLSTLATVVVAAGLTAGAGTAPAGAVPSRGTGNGFLHTSGAQIVDAAGTPVRLTGLNWFGGETSNHTVHGLWARGYRSILDQVSGLGYNTLRLPWSDDLFLPGATTNGINEQANPDLKGLSPLQVFDKVIAYAGSRGMRVILDHHRPDSNAQSALWYTAAVPESTWVAHWKALAARYKGNPVVVGADLHNEPHNDHSATSGSCWGCGDVKRDWRLAAERAGNAILGVNPDWLIVVEGVDSTSEVAPGWWGGNLSLADTFPVRLSRPDKLVYSAHEYANSVFHQTWFDDPAFPANLPAQWDREWGFLITSKIAPVLLGEFGSTLRDPKDVLWLKKLMQYLGTGATGTSFTYWALNPNSGDTGGILNDDWTTVSTAKQSILQPYLDGKGEPLSGPIAPAPPVDSPSAASPSAASASGPAPAAPVLSERARPSTAADPGAAAPPAGEPSTAQSAAASRAGVLATRSASCAALSLVTATWPGGYRGSVTVQNLGAELDPWTVGFRLSAGATLVAGWNATVRAAGSTVTATAPSWNTAVRTAKEISIGFLAQGVSLAATDVTLNGKRCGGSTGQATAAAPAAAAPDQSAVPAGDAATASDATVPADTAAAVPDAAAPSGSHAANPFTGAEGYLNPDYVARVTAQAAGTGGALGASMAKVARYPTAVWLDRIATVKGGTGVTRTLRGHLDAALAQQTASGKQVVATFVVYDLPNRDCAAFASNGELTVAGNGLSRYEHEYIDPIAAAFADPKYARLRIVAVVEPDSLPNLVTNLAVPACAEAKSSGAYVTGVRYALDALHRAPNVYSYLDIAHSGWLGWDSNFGPAADLLTATVKGTRAGLASVDGFVSNTANYTPLDEPYLPDVNRSVGGQPVRSAPFYEWNPFPDERRYVTAMRSALISRGFPRGIGMLVDTSRSGWGGPRRPAGAGAATSVAAFVDGSRIDRRLHRGNWCNQPGGIGARPQAAPAAGIDAYVWVKPPGESDGTSNRAQTTPDAQGKRFDVMCDPTARSRYNSAYGTGAMAGAPAAGDWYATGFATLVANASPAL